MFDYKKMLKNRIAIYCKSSEQVVTFLSWLEKKDTKNIHKKNYAFKNYTAPVCFRIFKDDRLDDYFGTGSKKYYENSGAIVLNYNECLKKNKKQKKRKIKSLCLNKEENVDVEKNEIIQDVKLLLDKNNEFKIIIKNLIKALK